MIDELTYPLPRRRRAGPPTNVEVAQASSGVIGATPPRTRYFPYVLNMTANSRRTISTAILTGPAILRRWAFFAPTPSDPPVQTVELGWAPNIVTEAGVALTTVRPYTLLLEKLDPFGVISVSTGGGYPGWTFPNTHVRWEYTADLIVTETRFVFTLSWVNNSGSIENRHGHMLVLENVNADALNLFTGS